MRPEQRCAVLITNEIRRIVGHRAATIGLRTTISNPMVRGPLLEHLASVLHENRANFGFGSFGRMSLKAERYCDCTAVTTAMTTAAMAILMLRFADISDFECIILIPPRPARVFLAAV